MADLLSNIKTTLSRWASEAKYRFDVFRNYTLKKAFVGYAIKIPGQIYEFFKSEVFFELFKVERRFRDLPKIARLSIALLLLSVVTAGLFYCAYRIVPSRDDRRARFYERARQFYASGKYPEAVIEFKNAIQLVPNNADAHYNLAHAYIYLSRLRDAAAELYWCVQLNPQRWDAVIKLNVVKSLLDDPRAAEYKEETPLRRGDKYIRGRTLMAKVMVASGDFRSAKAEVSRLGGGDPDSLDINILMADISISDMDMQKAMVYLTRARAIDDNSFEVHVKIGTVFMYQNDFKKALDEFLIASRISPDNPMVHAAIGDCYMRAGKYDSAVESYKKAYEINKKFTRAVENICNILIFQGKIAEAEPYIAELSKLSPDAPNTLLNRSILLFSESRSEEALNNIKESLKKKGDSFQAQYIYARMLAAVGKLDEAKEAYRGAIRLNPNIIEPRIELVDIYIKQKDYDKAVDEAEKTASIDPKDHRVKASLGMVYMLMNNHEAAKAQFDDIVKRYPARPDGYFLLGMLDQTMGNMKEAEKEFIAALGRDMGYMSAFYALMNIYMNAGSYQKVVNMCEKMLRVNPNSPQVYEILGSVFSALNRNDEASGFYEKAVDINPRSMSARAALAKLYMARKMQLNALVQYEEMLRMSPKNRQLLLSIASIYQARGDNDKALEHFEKALALQFDFALANDIAWFYARSGKDLDRALELAVKAEDASGHAHQVTDTVGWIMLKKGMYEEAAEKFGKCVEMSGSDPVYKYHLGLALYGRGALPEALKVLSEAVDAAKPFDGSDDAKKIIQELKNKGVK